MYKISLDDFFGTCAFRTYWCAVEDVWLCYTVFRQAFLLIQYSFICKQYFFCSDREYQYQSADCFNNISWKLGEKIYWKNGKQLSVGKDLNSV